MTPIDPNSWFCLEARTRRDWLDSNDHVNVRYYYRMLAEAVYHMMDVELEGQKPEGPRPIFFTLESRFIYHRELRVDQRVQVYVRPLERTEKVLKAMVRIHRVDPDPGLSAECHWVGAFVDPATRRIRPLDEAAKRNFDVKLAEGDGKPFAPPRVAPGFIPPEDRKAVVTFEGRIGRDWIDRMGHVGIEHYMVIFLHGNWNYLDAFDRGFAVARENNWGPFALETWTQYKAEIREGDEVRVTTRIDRLGRKALTWRHELWRLRETPTLSATYLHSMVFCDLTARRAIPFPEVYRRELERLHAIEIPEVVV